MAQKNLIAIVIYSGAISAAFVYVPLALILIALPAAMYFLPEGAWRSWSRRSNSVCSCIFQCAILAMKPLAVFLIFLVTARLTIAVSPETKKASSTPQYGNWGFDTAGADLKTKPGDDFFRYANGAWLDRVKIPADKPAYSLRLAMSDTVEQRLHDLMEAAAKTADHKPETTEGKVGAFYKSFMNEKGVEKNGASPLKGNISGFNQRRHAKRLPP